MNNGHASVESVIQRFSAAWGPSKSKVSTSHVTMQFRLKDIPSLRAACEAIPGARIFQDIAMPRERGMTEMLMIVDGVVDDISFHVEAVRTGDDYNTDLIVYQPDESQKGPINAGPIFSSCLRILSRIGGDPADAVVAFAGWALRKAGGAMDEASQRRLLAGLARLVAERLSPE